MEILQFIQQMKDKLVTVHTTYARIALILLAANLLLAGYTINKISAAQEAPAETVLKEVPELEQ
jgi:hypothetical protein